MTKNLDIILPVYKEQDNIERVLTGIKQHVKTPHTVNLVFYSRKDPTVPVVQKLKKQYPNLKLLFDNGNGLASQLKLGFKKTGAPLITIMMSDLSDNPKDIDKMVSEINKGYDFICASRYIPKGQRRGGSRMKALLSFLGCESLYLLSGIKSHDATNAFKCFKRGILNSITIESRVGYELPLELIIKAHLLGYRIGEIPTVWTERDTGYSKFKLFTYIPNYLRWYFYGFNSHIQHAKPQKKL